MNQIAADFAGPFVKARPRDLLHVGCGAADPGKIPATFFTPGQWRETRLDIDPSVAPDIVSSITDMAAVPEQSYDAVWSSHNIEHLARHEVPLALAEFHRVLRPGGFALIATPDLRQAAALIAEGRLEEPAYISPAGPIAPIDILYGFSAAIAAGNGFMGHRTGFTAATLKRLLTEAGFAGVEVVADGRFALWASAIRV